MSETIRVANEMVKRLAEVAEKEGTFRVGVPKDVVLGWFPTVAPAIVNLAAEYTEEKGWTKLERIIGDWLRINLTSYGYDLARQDPND